MKKALVTGGTGFIGSNLCRRLLNEGWKVFLITKKEFGYDNVLDIKNKMDIYEYEDNFNELMEYIKSIEVDVVFHLASTIITEHTPNDIHKILQGNIVFGTEVLEAIKYSKTKLLVNTGTYWQHYNNEEYNPVDLYAATKEAFQNLIRYYTEAEELRCITLKLFDTYGEKDKRPKLINLLNKFADEGTELNMSPGEQILDLVHVDDIVEAYLVAYKNLIENPDLKYKNYAVASGDRYSLKEVIELFENLSGKKLNINWGGREYRKREVMIPWDKYEILPNFKNKIKLEKGLEKF
ncbi:NAD(P)-dependent oxidoreductase [Cetobacterium sp. ZWU0022]|uniref:NAD-dependent epimerase/dehydratase family protein n=1 Tax=Cetobacterium sp. ZWU0022 TaxID=1340502 RepID=UPI0006476ABB|nr:NAD(P)-dependent oxidoreductase [Cetobacterium sp. ZWU0022]